MAEKHGVPLLFSLFIPGLGQIIKKHILKGIMFMILMFISGLLTVVLIGFITTPLIYIWNLIDAYNSD